MDQPLECIAAPSDTILPRSMDELRVLWIVVSFAASKGCVAPDMGI